MKTKYLSYLKSIAKKNQKTQFKIILKITLCEKKPMYNFIRLKGTKDE